MAGGAVTEHDGSGGTDLGGGACVAPGCKIEFRPAAELRGDDGGHIRVGDGRDAGGEGLLEYLEHGSAVRARIGQVETLVDHRKIGDDVALHRLHDGSPIIDRWVLDLTAIEAIDRKSTRLNSSHANISY